METCSQFIQTQAYFDRNPSVDYAYLFFDGHFEADYEVQARLTSRVAQLVSIASDGIPMLVSRHSCDVQALIAEASGVGVQARLARRRLDDLAAIGLARMGNGA
jgi:hypothetical protein